MRTQRRQSVMTGPLVVARLLAQYKADVARLTEENRMLKALVQSQGEALVLKVAQVSELQGLLNQARDDTAQFRRMLEHADR